MGKRIAIIQGHPDPAGNRYLHALADAFAAGAAEGGHELRRIEVARLEFPILRTQADFQHDAIAADLLASQDAIRWAQHIVILYPLWLGTMPALLKAFFEQAFRPGFAFDMGEGGGWAKKLLTGRSAHVVVTMGMPAWVYRWYFGAHSLKSLERNVLGFVGIKPVRETLIGGVETMDAARRQAWIARLRESGRAGR